jgi:hypothetical protein
MYSWIYRDDIGAPHGIHGYEEQVNSVGQHHGHFHWTQEGFQEPAFLFPSDSQFGCEEYQSRQEVYQCARV